MDVIIYDIETLKELFLVVLYNPKDNSENVFQISKFKNNSDSLIRYLEENYNFYFVGYNNLRFDSQVIQYFYLNHDKWHELSGLEICQKIYQFAQDTIDDANYELFAKYSESALSFKQIDLFKINHYDNKNRRVSLKRLEFEMDFENIEEMPIHHSKVNMTLDDIDITIGYCKNDVRATYEFYKITTGNTEHPLYKNNNQIQLRLDIQEEFGINCINYSDSKIGDEIIKKYYTEEKNISIKELPSKGYFRKEIRVKDCIAPYINFKTKQLKQFHKEIKGRILSAKDEFVESIIFADMEYTFAKGGIHSVNKPEMFESDDEYEIIDWDVSSYYPAIIINNKKYPAHLGKEFLIGYKKLFEKRLALKRFAKTDKKIAGIVGALKLAVNSVYGKSSDMLSWIYDRQLTMFTTITGELSLLMLIEAYHLAGIKTISANTDGVTILIKKSDLDKMIEINKWWSELTSYELERTDYSKIIFSTVNDYLAIKTNGEIKKKGDFLTDFELHKNKSKKIIGIALENYFVNDIDVETTINNHNNIYDFCIRQKASRDFHYEGYENGKVSNVYDKLIRYYVSYEGEKIFKIKNPECLTNAPASSQIEAGLWLCEVCNDISKANINNVNRSYYIEKTYELIYKIKYNGKKVKKIIPNQLNLF